MKRPGGWLDRKRSGGECLRALVWQSCCCLLLVLMPACRQPGGVSRPPVRLVTEILSDRERPERTLVEAHATPERLGAIHLVGSPESCRELSALLCRYDRFNNVSGASHEDGLPDFAGETFIAISDTAHVPYAAWLDGREEDLRVLTVRHALAALDTRCHVSPYDLDGHGEKAPAKLIALADPLLCAYGKSDVDTLFSSLSCRVPVLSALDLMIDALPLSPQRGLHVGVLCGPQAVGTGAYAIALQRRVSRGEAGASDCLAYSMQADTLTSPLQTFLDYYIAAGSSDPLDALLVDDARVNPETVAAELARIRDLSCALSLQYGRFLAQDFRVIVSRDLLAQACYRVLRERNLFTHYIAGPKVRFYETVATPEEEGIRVMLVPSPYVQD